MDNFWLGVLQTFIGSSLGFGLGVVAFHYQQKHQSAQRAKEDWRAALDALHRLDIAAGANIESLAVMKLLPLTSQMAEECRGMKEASDEAYNAPTSQRKGAVTKLRHLSVSSRYFYHTIVKPVVMPVPEFREYSALSKDMPALSLFVHRAMGMTQTFDEVTETRNRFNSERAREDMVGNGINEERFIYYAGMLSSTGLLMHQYVDNALGCWMIVRDQIQAFVEKKAGDQSFQRYQIVPNAARVLPKDELFPLMREQMATFENQ